MGTDVQKVMLIHSCRSQLEKGKGVMGMWEGSHSLCWEDAGREKTKEVTNRIGSQSEMIPDS